MRLTSGLPVFWPRGQTLYHLIADDYGRLQRPVLAALAAAASSSLDHGRPGTDVTDDYWQNRWIHSHSPGMLGSQKAVVEASHCPS